MIAIDETGQGPPLVLLHGVGASRAVWRRVTPALAEDRRVIAPDLPGFGESAPAANGFELDTAAAALADPLAERAGGPFDLLGNSLGGAVALRLAVARPDLVRRLVLAAPAGFAPGPRRAARPPRARSAIRRSRSGARRRPGRAVPTARRALLWGAIAEPQRLARRRCANDAARHRAAPRRSARRWRRCSGLTCGPTSVACEAPLGVIWGWRDRIIPISTLR